jgi:excinuclease ABC subunit B
MQRAIDETTRRRATQLAYNEANGITPRTVRKSHSEIMGQTALSDYRIVETPGYANTEADGTALALAAEPVVAMMTKPELEKLIKTTEKQMEAAAKDLDFLTAAKLRDELAALRSMLKSKRD